MKLRSMAKANISTTTISVRRAPLHGIAPLALALALALGLATEGLTQVVQLPSYRNFSTTGSAWVPDGGTTALGGSGYSTAGSTSRGWGPGGTRALGGIAGGASMSASVQIIDLEAMDEAILAGHSNRIGNSPAQAAGATASAPAPPAAGPLAPRGVAASSLSASDPWSASRKQAQSVRVTPDHWARILSSSGEPTQVTHPALDEVNVQHYLQMGRAAEQGGRALAAGVYYRMAMEAMSPKMKQRYEQALVRREAESEAQRVQNSQRAAAMQFQP